MKASLKGRYHDDKSTAVATFSFNAADVKLRASVTDATVANGPNLNDLALALEKPGFFIIDYDVPKRDFRFQFMNSVRVANKPLNLTYIHHRGDNRTILDGNLVFDSANKVSANYVLGTGNCKLKYAYVHQGLTTFEPCYDLAKNSWDFAVSHRVYGDDVLRGTYQTSSKALGLEWSRNSKFNGSFKMCCRIVEHLSAAKELRGESVKLDQPLMSNPNVGGCGQYFKTHYLSKISASVDLADRSKPPKLTAETSWDLEI